LKVGKSGEELPEISADAVGRDEVLRADEAVDRPRLPAGGGFVEVVGRARGEVPLGDVRRAGQGAAVYAASITSELMAPPTRQKELGRGERVRPVLWRLRLPLPWPGVPHCNAWAIASGPGIVLVDTGMHEPGSLAQLERAMDQVNLRLEHVRLLACTHAHSDH